MVVTVAWCLLIAGAATLTMPPLAYEGFADEATRQRWLTVRIGLFALWFIAMLATGWPWWRRWSSTARRDLMIVAGLGCASVALATLHGILGQRDLGVVLRAMATLWLPSVLIPAVAMWSTLMGKQGGRWLMIAASLWLATMLVSPWSWPAGFFQQYFGFFRIYSECGTILTLVWLWSLFFLNRSGRYWWFVGWSALVAISIFFTTSRMAHGAFFGTCLGLTMIKPHRLSGAVAVVAILLFLLLAWVGWLPRSPLNTMNGAFSTAWNEPQTIASLTDLRNAQAHYQQTDMNMSTTSRILEHRYLGNLVRHRTDSTTVWLTGNWSDTDRPTFDNQYLTLFHNEGAVGTGLVLALWFLAWRWWRLARQSNDRCAEADLLALALVIIALAFLPAMAVLERYPFSLLFWAMLGRLWYLAHGPTPLPSPTVDDGR
jgi:hypothetical protein